MSGFGGESHAWSTSSDLSMFTLIGSLNKLILKVDERGLENDKDECTVGVVKHEHDKTRNARVADQH